MRHNRKRRQRPRPPRFPTALAASQVPPGSLRLRRLLLRLLFGRRYDQTATSRAQRRCEERMRKPHKRLAFRDRHDGNRWSGGSDDRCNRPGRFRTAKGRLRNPPKFVWGGLWPHLIHSRRSHPIKMHFLGWIFKRKRSHRVPMAVSHGSRDFYKQLEMNFMWWRFD